MAHEDCKSEWKSLLTRKLPKPPSTATSDGVITISDTSGKLQGKHTDSKLDFDITCKGDGTEISFVRIDDTNKKKIHYEGTFSDDRETIHGTYLRLDIAAPEGGGAAAAFAGDSGDWDATKPPAIITSQSLVAKKWAKTTKKKAGATTKKSAKKQARKSKA